MKRKFFQLQSGEWGYNVRSNPRSVTGFKDERGARAQAFLGWEKRSLLFNSAEMQKAWAYFQMTMPHADKEEVLSAFEDRYNMDIEGSYAVFVSDKAMRKFVEEWA